MKKMFVFTVIMGLHLSSFSQSKEEFKAALKEAENTKSGNLLDAFAGFYQFAFKSVTVDKKALELNSTLFALVKNYDEDLFLHTQSKAKIIFLRNFQINAKMNLNDNLNFDGYSAGFTYAVLNQRDKGFRDLSDLDVARHFDALNILINAAIINRTPNEITAGMSLSEKKKLSYILTDLGTSIVNDEEVDASLKTKKDNLVKELDAQIANSAYFQNLKDEKGNAIKITNTQEAVTYLNKLKKEHMQRIDNKPFLSFSSAGISDKTGKLNQASLESVFLAGSRFGEFDLRAKYSYADTISPSMKRGAFNGKLGYNFKLLRGEENKSYLEVKLYVEYNKVLNNLLPDEEENTTLFNTDIRCRLTDNLWIPLTIKYDKEKNNFLGLFNITYNFESVKEH